MRILHVCKFFFPSLGGMENYVRSAVEGLGELGHENTVVAYLHPLSAGQEFVSPYDVRFFEDISASGRPLAFWAGQPVHFVKTHDLRRISSRFDLIHVALPFPNVEWSTGSIASEVPTIVSWHADPILTRWRKFALFHRPVMSRLLGRVRRILPTSKYLMETSPSLNGFRHKCHVVHPCGDIVATPEFVRVVPTRVSKLLFVGRLRGYKGIDVLIQALASVPANVQLQIVGTGECLEAATRLVLTLGLESRVEFLGAVTNERLSELYQEAHVLVLPSVTEGEAFGLVQVEAMSFGLPVINTRLRSGVPFVSRHGETGLTVTPGNVAELASAITMISKDLSLWKRFSEAALKRASEFSRIKMAKDFECALSFGDPN